MGKSDPLCGRKPVVLREAAVTAHADWYSYYVDLQGWHSCVLEVEVAADANLDGSNYTVFEVWETDSATPATHTNSTQVAAGDLRIEIVDATGATTAVAATEKEVTIDSTSEDSVLLRFHYLGTKRYVHVMGDVTTAGSYPTGIVSVVAHLEAGREKPENTKTPTIAAVS